MAHAFADIPAQEAVPTQKRIKLGGKIPGTAEPCPSAFVQFFQGKRRAVFPKTFKIQIVFVDTDLPVAEIPQTFLVGDAEHGFQMGAAGGDVCLAGTLRQSCKRLGTGFRRPGDTGCFAQDGNAAQQSKKGFAAAGRAGGGG